MKSKNDFKRQIAKRLNEAMREAGYLTNVELAGALEKNGFKISTTALGEILTGSTSPRTETWIALKKVLGKSIDWLMTGEETKPDSSEVNRALTILEKLKASANDLPDSELSKMSKRFLGLPEDLRTAVEQLIAQMEVLAKEKITRK